MTQKKKLQVFVSSTYIDLHEERQAAVQAILTAGHIPAGMELFAAGDETQMNVIKRWIDESDVYMLILGGRYGSIEPKSQKSYIHLEYEYALEKNKPLFAVVIEDGHLDEKVKKDGLKAIEKDHSEKLKEFRNLVCSRMVRFWSDPKDIKLAVMETMSDFSKREDLMGWILGNEAINTGAVAEEIASLVKENKELREKLQTFQSNPTTYSGLTFEEMYKELDNIRLSTLVNLEGSEYYSAERISEELMASEPSLLHLFMAYKNYIEENAHWESNTTSREFAKLGLGTIERYPTETAKQFLLRLRIIKNDILKQIDEDLFISLE